MDYRTASQRAEHEEVIKGSRFLAWVAPVTGTDEAQGLLQEARERYPDASHHCWAWRCGAEQRFSDDGEPGGTAGRPMLEVILRRDLDYVAAVVTRWFGGTRLGAGGLVRAYGGATARALDTAGSHLVEARTELLLRVPFSLEDSVQRFLATADGVRTEASAYTAAGLELRASIPVRSAKAFAAALTDHTRGGVAVTIAS